MITALFDLSVLATSTRTRGIGRYIADLAHALGSAAHEDVRVRGIERLHLSGRADVADDLDAAVWRLTASGAPRIAHAAWSYRVRVAAARATRALAPDVLHLGHPAATPLGNPGCPRVTTCHDLIPLLYPAHYLDWRDGFFVGRWWLDHRRFHSADHVIAVSESTAHDLVAVIGVPARRITVVHSGVDATRWSPLADADDAGARARFGLDGARYLLFVGAADWRKNAEGMLRALAIARRSEPDLVLAWAARLDPDELDAVRSAAREAGVGDALRLLGYVPDAELAALYRGALAQLFVSRAEGFGYPLLEAMASGCPVIASDRATMAEIAGDAAWLVDPERPEAIADAIVGLTRSGSERQRLRDAGIARAARFTLARMAAGTLDVYRDVARRGR